MHNYAHLVQGVCGPKIKEQKPFAFFYWQHWSTESAQIEQKPLQKGENWKSAKYAKICMTKQKFCIQIIFTPFHTIRHYSSWTFNTRKHTSKIQPNSDSIATLFLFHVVGNRALPMVFAWHPGWLTCCRHRHYRGSHQQFQTSQIVIGDSSLSDSSLLLSNGKLCPVSRNHSISSDFP